MKLIFLFKAYIYFVIFCFPKTNSIIHKKIKIPSNHTQTIKNFNPSSLNNFTKTKNALNIEYKDNFAYKFVSFPKGNKYIFT